MAHIDFNLYIQRNIRYQSNLTIVDAYDVGIDCTGATIEWLASLYPSKNIILTPYITQNDAVNGVFTIDIPDTLTKPIDAGQYTHNLKITLSDGTQAKTTGFLILEDTIIND